MLYSLPVVLAINQLSVIYNSLSRYSMVHVRTCMAMGMHLDGCFDMTKIMSVTLYNSVVCWIMDFPVSNQACACDGSSSITCMSGYTSL